MICVKCGWESPPTHGRLSHNTKQMLFIRVSFVFQLLLILSLILLLFLANNPTQRPILYTHYGFYSSVALSQFMIEYFILGGVQME